jgi:calcium binding protein 39
MRNLKAILELLVDGLDDQDIAFSCGAILRECLRYEEIGKLILLGPRFYEFFQFVQCPQFDVASDAFLTLKFEREKFFFVCICVCFYKVLFFFVEKC